MAARPAKHLKMTGEPSSSSIPDQWRELLLAHAHERPTRDLAVLRSKFKSTNNAAEAEAELTEQIRSDITNASSTLPEPIQLSHVLFAALDFDFGRRALRPLLLQEGESNVVMAALTEYVQELVTCVCDAQQEVSPAFLAKLRHLDRALECVSRIDVSPASFPGGALAELVRRVLGEFSHARHGTKFLRTASLALVHVSSSGNNNNEQASSPLVRAALVFARISLIKSADSSAAWLDEIGALMSYSLESKEDVDRVMLALEALCAWCTKRFSAVAAAAAGQDDTVEKDAERAFALCIPFAEHSSLGTLSLNSYERIVQACVKLDSLHVLLQREAQRLMHELTSNNNSNSSSHGRGFYLMLEKFTKNVGAKRTLEWTGGNSIQLVRALLGQASGQEVVGNGTCNCLCALFKCWLKEDGNAGGQLLRDAFSLLAAQLQLGQTNVFVNFHLVRKLLTDFFGEFHSAEEIAAHKLLGEHLLRDLQQQQQQDTHLWARLSVLLALERGGIQVAVIPDDQAEVALVAVRQSELERALRSADHEVRNTAWALATTRVKKSSFPSAGVLGAVAGALEHMIKHDAQAVKRDVERLVERVAMLLQPKSAASAAHKKKHSKKEDEEEDAKAGKARCRDFLDRCARVLAAQLYPDAPVHALSLALSLAAQLLQLQPVSTSTFPLCSKDTFAVLLSLLVHAPFDSTRAQAYTVLELMPADVWREEESSGRLAAFVQHHLATPSSPAASAKSRRRDCDATATLFRLLHRQLLLKGEEHALPWLHFSSPSAADDDDRMMRQALCLAKQCTTVDTAYDVGCVIIDSATGEVLATGYSRELEGNTHAEEVALSRLPASSSSSSSSSPLTLYTTMEPCSLRLSGKECCASLILKHNNLKQDGAHRRIIARVVVGVNEPDLFVKDCQGVVALLGENVDVGRVSASLANECLAASTGHALTRSETFVSEIVHALQPQQPQPSQPSLVQALMTLRSVLRDCAALPTPRVLPKKSSSSLVRLLLTCVTRSVQRLVDFNDEGHYLGSSSSQEAIPDEPWLEVSEGSDALVEVLERTDLTAAASDNADADVIAACDWFLDTALQLKHSGALTHVTKCLERVVRLLLQTTRLQHVVIKLWLPRLFSQARREEEFDRAIRRNEGFCFCFRAVVRAAEQTRRADVVELVCQQLVQHEPVKRPAHLNVLKALMEDAVSARAVAAYVSPCIQLAVEAFSSREWKIRSAALSLMVSALRRIVGDQPSKTCASVNSAQAVFSSYPSLVPVLERELALAVREPSSDQLALYPLLLFLASMKPSSSSSGGGGAEAATFAQLALTLSHQHPVFQVRAAAARAWAVLDDAATAAPSPQGDTSQSENAQHGYLLCLRERGGSGDLAEASRILLASSSSFICRELAIELARPSLDWLEAEARRFAAASEEAHSSSRGDGDEVGKTRYYTRAVNAFVDRALEAGEAEVGGGRLASVLELLLPSASTVALGAFQRLAEQLDSTRSSAPPPAASADGLIQALFARATHTEHVEALAQLLRNRPNTASSSSSSVAVVLALAESKPRNVRLQAAALRVMSAMTPSSQSAEEFASRLKQATRDSALEVRLAAAWCVGDGGDLVRRTCALQLLCDEEELVRVAALERLPEALSGLCVGAAFHALWAQITADFALDRAWLNQLVEWTLAPSDALVAAAADVEDDGEEEECIPLEFSEPKQWALLASRELCQVREAQLAAGVLSQQEAQGLARRALDAFRRSGSSSTSSCFVDVYAASCAVRALVGEEKEEARALARTLLERGVVPFALRLVLENTLAL